MLAPAPLFIADHPALDILNTVITQEGAAVDTWQSDADVLQWLAASGMAVPAAMPGLLPTARDFREQWRALVAQRQAGDAPDLASLNRWLAQAVRSLQVTHGESGEWGLAVHYAQASAAQLLAPVVEAAADLLVNGDWGRVHKCEDHGCSLLFYDRSKAQRRRWCSMALCGNRNKVASFRKRQQQ